MKKQNSFKKKYSLNNDQINKLLLNYLNGKSINYSCKELNVSYHTIMKYFFKWIEMDVVPIKIGVKEKPYYIDELDYSRTPTYTWDSLNYKELQAYFIYELKHKAYYEL